MYRLSFDEHWETVNDAQNLLKCTTSPKMLTHLLGTLRIV